MRLQAQGAPRSGCPCPRGHPPERTLPHRRTAPGIQGEHSPSKCPLSAIDSHRLSAALHPVCPERGGTLWLPMEESPRTPGKVPKAHSALWGLSRTGPSPHVHLIPPSLHWAHSAQLSGPPGPGNSADLSIPRPRGPCAPCMCSGMPLLQAPSPVPPLQVMRQHRARARSSLTTTAPAHRPAPLLPGSAQALPTGRFSQAVTAGLCV